MPNEPSGRLSWRQCLARVAYRLGRRLDAARRRLRPSRRSERATVEPYLGYGDGRTVRVRGRALLDPGIDAAPPGQSWLATLRVAWRRFDSAELPFARVRVAVGPAARGDGPVAGEREIVADEEGHLDAVLVPPEPLAPGWAPVRFVLLEPAPRDDRTATVRGEALVPGADAPFGVISDIDDTVLVTGATRLREVLRRTLLEDVHERLPFPGAPALYRAFAAQGAPTFYVSSSPWNLHAPLLRFLRLNGLPVGPLALRDWGLTPPDEGGRGHAGHKGREIAAILASFPRLAFVLVGDSGQEDPEIYAALARERPGRIRGVLIRHVAGAGRATVVEELAASARRAGVPFALVRDSAEAARRAEAEGWIDADARRACEAACAAAERGGDDEGPPTDAPQERV